MSNELMLSLGDLVPRTITRDRGAEAAKALSLRASAVNAPRVYLDTEARSPVSTSFVDELVQQAARMECEGGPEVVFVIHTGEMLEKLQKSVTWRELTCRYRRAGDTEVRTLRPGLKSKIIANPEMVSKAELFAAM